jgi:hypothetical protein
VPSPASLTHISQLEESGETNQEKELTKPNIYTKDGIEHFPW